MSNLVETIYRLMREHRPKLLKGELSNKAGISASHLSHILTGKQKSLHVEDAGRMALAFGPARKQAELIHAYLLDHLPDVPGSKLVKIEVLGVEPEEPRPRLKLEPKVEDPLDKIARRAATSRDMRNMIIWLGSL